MLEGWDRTSADEEARVDARGDTSMTSFGRTA